MNTPQSLPWCTTNSASLHHNLCRVAPQSLPCCTITLHHCPIWNDLPDDVHSAKSLSSFRQNLKNLSLRKGIPTIVFTICLCRFDLSNVSGLMIITLHILVLCALETINRWRLGAIKVILELQLHQKKLYPSLILQT